MTKLKLTGKNGRKKNTIVKVGDVSIGEGFTMIAGPCSVETEQQTVQTAIEVKAAGAHMLRGGAFKPRTSPYDFQGLGLKGLKILEKAKKETGLPIVTEVIDPRDVTWVCEYADVLQIGGSQYAKFLAFKRSWKSR
jgi:3-deoxy-7-phosphoheptulonate synthase